MNPSNILDVFILMGVVYLVFRDVFSYTPKSKPVPPNYNYPVSDNVLDSEETCEQHHFSAWVEQIGKGKPLPPLESTTLEGKQCFFRYKYFCPICAKYRGKRWV